MTRVKIPALLLALFTLLSSGACASVKGNVFPLGSSYLKEEQLYTRLKEVASINPGLAKLRVIGFSGTLEIPLYALEIGVSGAPRKILIIGQHHGDEVLGVQLSIALAEEILREWKRDGKWGQILEEFQFWIVPTINPEAWRSVSRGEFQWKRKNNRDTDKNKRFDLRTDGIDLNRNYPVFWADDPPVPTSSPYYKGERPASEPEVQAVMKLAETQKFDLAIFYHSSASGAYSEKIYLPAWVAGDKKQNARIEKLMAFARSYASLIKKDYLKGTYEVGEGNSSRVGNARNYFFHTHNTDAFLVELGGINSSGTSVIHPPEKTMHKIVEKHLKALRKALHARAVNKDDQ